MFMSRTKKLSFLIDLALAALFLALGFVLPFLTGQIPEIGNMLLPMHIPVFLCGFICGPSWGAVVGFVLPLLRSAIFSMPPLYPTALAMAFELLTYGLVSGLFYKFSRKKNLLVIYSALIVAMFVGRGVWGIVDLIFTSVQQNALTWSAFLASAFLNAVPGIILQLVLIPAVMFILQKTNALRYKEGGRMNSYPQGANKENVQKVIDLINSKKEEGSLLLVGIDGRCGSGKTALATAINKKTGYPVIHADDFFLHPEQRCEERLNTPGENLDWERLEKEVLKPLKEGETPSYEPWDCHNLRYGENIVLPKSGVYIVEGSYCLNHHLRSYYDLTVFLDVDKSEQLNRIANRKGKNNVEDFEKKWIPLEEKYFQASDLENTVDLKLLSK